MPANILAIDTATEACSVALQANNQITALFEVCPREHTQRILPMVQQVLQQQGMTLSELDALAFGRGPGSFTGVRIGISVAQGLGMGAALPLVGVSTLAAMAQGVWRLNGAQRVLTAIDARMGEVYWAEYQRDAQGNWQGEETEAVLRPEEALERMTALRGEWAIAGTGWQAWPQLKESTNLNLSPVVITLPAAEDILPVAEIALAAGCSVAAENAEPVYLRNEVTWKKLPGRA